MNMRRMNTLQHVGVYAMVAGGAIFVGSMAIPAVKPYGKYVKMLAIGGAVIFVIGMVI